MKAAEMLNATAGMVGGQRAEDYGDKYVNHMRIAKLWTMWLNERRPDWLSEDEQKEPEIQITPYDVAMMMLLVKVARLMHSPGHQDCHIDIAGYASVMEEIIND
jgi:hypothetical protein